MNVTPATPLTDFILYNNVGLDNSYEASLTFENASAQQAYFNTKVYTSFEKLTPIRENTLRLTLPSTSLETCPYCSFVQKYEISGNTYASQRRWYAFITNVKYINALVSEVTIEVDVIQSNLFYWKLGTSYVERMHVNSDAIGEWVQAEPISISESDFLYDWVEKVTFGSGNVNDIKMAICVWFQDGSHLQAKQISNIFTGANVAVYPDTDTGRQQLSDWLDSLGDNLDRVINICMMPYVGNYYPTGGNFTFAKRFNAQGFRQSYYGYTPKNNKMFSYPYHSLCVYNSRGESNEYKFELFKIDSSSNAALQLQWAMSPDVCVVATINDYYDDQYGRSSGALTETGFPQCSWNTVAYQAWLSQITSDVFGFAAGMSTSIATGNAFGAAATIAGQGTKTALDIARPPMAKAGSMCGCSTNYNRLGFYIYNKCLQKDIAETVDNFFTRYGYSINKCVVPVIRGREYFNYIQTKDLNIRGNVSMNDMKRIREIFNRGITFWHNERGHEIGDNYSSNPIV
ncbi:hypothetical protein [Bacteroides acidifaciens]|uniref:hypothetical protein n=1 Tax=Bacteroides acidifaciens TaxID=85831 RepID=UPI0025AE7B5C|nr:hypothetical protein [Bacteroides acidifaciens]